jgi:AcrR family transcriptional regulator
VRESANHQTMRADARRNRDRLLAVASAVIAERGAEASLEEIARRAGVGSATLHRHFRGRQALLDAVFHDRVDALCSLAHTLARTGEGGGTDAEGAADSGTALVTWLRAVVAHAAANRGLGASLMLGVGEAESVHARILDAGRSLLTRAQAERAAHPDIDIADLLTLVNAISLATEQDPDRAGRADHADRLLTLVVHGVGYPPPSR